MPIFGILTDLDALLRLLVLALLHLAGFVHFFLRAGDDPALAQNLRVKPRSEREGGVSIILITCVIRAIFTRKRGIEMTLQLKVTVRNTAKEVLLTHTFSVEKPGDVEKGVHEATHRFRQENPDLLFGWYFTVDKA